MKEQRGITLVALILTVVLLLILASVSISIGTESLDQTRLKGFYTQLEIIQKRVDDIAATNENYVDDEGNIVYLKEQGADLDDEQKTSLQAILNTEEITVEVTNFRYFTVNDLENILDLSEIEYNVFIDFDNRIVIAENGVTVGDKTYYALENSTYFVEYNSNKNVDTTNSLTINYTVIKYSSDTYKITVMPNNVGDIGEVGELKYKTTTSKYWETPSKLEIIVELEKEYNVLYTDSNNNTVEEIIKVELDDSNEPIVTKIN